MSKEAVNGYKYKKKTKREVVNKTLHNLICELGMSYNEFASLLKVGNSSVYDWIYYGRVPRGVKLKMICELFDKRPYHIFNKDISLEELEEKINKPIEKENKVDENLQKNSQNIAESDVIVVENDIKPIESEHNYTEIEENNEEIIENVNEIVLKDSEEVNLKSVLDRILGCTGIFMVIDGEGEIISAITIPWINKIANYNGNIVIYGANNGITIHQDNVAKYKVSYEDIIAKTYHFMCEV